MVFMCIKHVDNKRLATFQSRFPATRKVRSHQLNDKQNLSSTSPPPPPKTKQNKTKRNKATCTSFRLACEASVSVWFRSKERPKNGVLGANSGMTGQVGGFQNPGVCLQAFPSFLLHPLQALLLAPFFARS